MTSGGESPSLFRSGGNALFGMLHESSQPAETAVLILVGGPQYRVGSHRMFVQIARELARADYIAFRFDFTGMGDSDGVFPGFERVSGDVRAALDHLSSLRPTIKRFVLLGLCDGATAAATYAATDSRVSAVVLLNPWVHTEVAEAKAFLWYYYPRRIVQLDFWRQFVRGRVSVLASMKDFLGKVLRVLSTENKVENEPRGSFVDRMRASLESFAGRVLVVTSERDFTASEFTDLWSTDPAWRRIRDSSALVRLESADHTLSSAEDLRKFCRAVADWLARSDGRRG